ncbi:cable pilus system hybrid histidine kinase CblT [Burkholderia cenocepacia]|uniref:cable pilus system hybrid histidine kinase CblT n=1 Tax=Burkholderia cenocepacia TaxID=95486 RepID=UPI000D68DC55|nr:cable pilus system hybrid histidine kinase CblT [Burkholderia cenocepacia]MCW3660519.1 cable pilus system hybrid histidine kinase CblT [Burkholderia cenocepacia]MDS0803462.1 cable pilus system hybrid histidine kinase CblT [Burkholderia cenocepacia]
MVSRKGRAVLIGMMIGLMPAPGRAIGAPQFTAEEKAWIAAHPVVRTRADSKWRPFEFRENGKVVGVVPSFLAAISQISGLRFEYVDDITWRDSVDALRAGRIDIVPDVTWRSAYDAPKQPAPGAKADVTASDDATSLLSNTIVSRPYFVGTVLVVAPEHMNLFVDSRNLAGRRVAIKGGGALEAAIRNGDIPVTLLTYDDERDALAAVSHGDADVAIGPDMSVLPLLQRQYRNKLFVSGGLPDNPYALAIATRRDMPVLASILDKSLAAISARDAEIIARQWIESTDYGKPSLHSILYYRRWQVAAAAAGLLALAAIAFASWRSRAVTLRSARDKAMFFAFISHEIRTPMHTILSSLELLQRAKLPPKQAGRADAAVAASESLLTLLDDILDYSRLESRNVTLAPEPTHVEPWVQRSADMVRWRVDEKQLGFALELACPPALCVLIDPVRTRQIVLNLLVNAIKFTSAGSIALRVEYLDGKPDRAGSLVLEVRDTGIGIPPERQRRIFEPYQRVEQAGNRRVAGSGLGLSICRELVDLMKGVITVSSSADKGTVFTVILPARRIAHAPAASTADAREATPESSSAVRAQAPADADTPPPAGNGRMILVVDDHEAVQHAIQHQLDALACRSTVADTGEQALAQFERATFDLVLLDCNLPDIDGYTVVRRMRDSERQRKQARTPIIAISASTGDAHRERCFDSGMDGVLGKPLRLDALRQMIDLWCAAGVADEIAPPAGDTQSAKADFRAIYRQSVEADLAVLGDALSNDDAERARHASHRIKGAAAIAGHAATSELAAELERRLQLASGGMPPSIRALGDELLRRHRADMAGPNTRERESGGPGA